MTDSNRQPDNPEPDDLAARLEWSTSAQSTADLDGETALDTDARQWRDAWTTFTRHLDQETPPLDTDALLAKLQAELEPAAAPVRPTPLASESWRGAWWLAIAGGVLALLAGGYLVVSQLFVTPSGAPNAGPLAGDDKKAPSEKNVSPEEKPAPPVMVQEKERPVAPDRPAPEGVLPEESPRTEDLADMDWDDREVEAALTAVKTQVYSVDADWNASRDANLLDAQLQELEEQIGTDEMQ